MYRTIGGVLLVAGTAVGAGMLALPVVTGFAGFVPSIALFLIYWIFMTYTALLILEVNLWMTKSDGNMITMAEMTLGFWGKVACWIGYLFLLYALTTAYLAGGGAIINGFLQDLVGWHLPRILEPVPLLLLLGFFVYRGAHAVDFINRPMMGGLVLSYLAMVFFVSPYVDPTLLKHTDFKMLWIGSSIVATSFGFHIVIPTLTTYLHRDVVALKRVIFLGSGLTLLVYIVWQTLVLGIVPLEGPMSLTSGFESGTNGANLLSAYLGHGALAELARMFSLLAIITSFLGVSMSLTDFLKDGLNISESRLAHLGVVVLTFVPPLIIASIDPRAFLSALDYAGAFGVVFLLGLLPALMVWQGRKKYGKDAIYRAPGGQVALMLAIACSMVAIGIEISKNLG